MNSVVRYAWVDPDGRTLTPAILILTGFMATGKTTIGRLVAGRLGLPFVDLDDEIERRAGRTIATIFREVGEARFRELEAAALRDALTRPGYVLATGGGALLPADAREEALAAGLVVCLRVTPEEILRRIGDAADRPLLAGAAEPLARIRALLAEREDAYAAIPCHVETTGKSPAQVAEEVVAQWLKTEPLA